jgi:hypothetical protein
VGNPQWPARLMERTNDPGGCRKQIQLQYAGIGGSYSRASSRSFAPSVRPFLMSAFKQLGTALAATLGKAVSANSPTKSATALSSQTCYAFSELPHAFGCDDWRTARVTTCEEFDQALQTAGKSSSGVYIEVVTDAYAASPLAMKLHDAVKTLYAS